MLGIPKYKLNLKTSSVTTFLDGYRSSATFMIGGIDAADKGKTVAEAIVKRVQGILNRKGLDDFDEVSIEVLGAEATYGEQANSPHTREVVVKIAVSHQDKKALTLFGMEIAQAATAMAPGITGLVGGRPKPSPRLCLFSFLWDKSKVDVTFSLITSGAYDNRRVNVSAGVTGDRGKSARSHWVNHPLPEPVDADGFSVPLVELALARSGDKGDHCNVGVIARDERYLPYIEAALTTERLTAYFAHLLSSCSEIHCYQLPVINSLNIVMTHSLGGGGMASLRIDPQGKAVAQQLLSMPVAISKQWFDQVRGGAR